MWRKELPSFTDNGTLLGALHDLWHQRSSLEISTFLLSFLRSFICGEKKNIRWLSYIFFHSITRVIKVLWRMFCPVYCLWKYITQWYRVDLKLGCWQLSKKGGKLLREMVGRGWYWRKSPTMSTISFSEYFVVRIFI